MKITFIYEMADICERVGANVQKVARGQRSLAIALLHLIARQFVQDQRLKKVGPQSQKT